MICPPYKQTGDAITRIPSPQGLAAAIARRGVGLLEDKLRTYLTDTTRCGLSD